MYIDSKKNYNIYFIWVAIKSNFI